MTNFFYGYGLMWIVVLLLYSLGWSDLCFDLQPGLLATIIFIIILSFIIGYIFRKELKYKENRNIIYNNKLFIVLLFCYVIEFIFEGSIPLFKVLNGVSYTNISFNGIPKFHIIITAASIVYSFYLSYIFVNTHNKKSLINFGLIIFYFMLIVQRQNIFICIIGFFNFFIADIRIRNNNKQMSKHEKWKKIIVTGILLMVSLYVFGVIGNMRYGSSWEWNDSSMITKLGKKNDKYPKYLPNEYFWSYIYIVSPLVNLNYNIEMTVPTQNIGEFVKQFIPDYISNKMFDSYKKSNILLPVSSLTASTAFIRAYQTFGYFGMLLLFIIQYGISILIFKLTKKHNNKLFMINLMSLIYVNLFSFFTNTLIYTTTSLILIISFAVSLGIKNNKWR